MELVWTRFVTRSDITELIPEELWKPTAAKATGETTKRVLDTNIEVL